MTTYLPSGRPAWAVTMWMDDSAVYMELPCKDGPPYITRYELCEGGLSKALGMMRDIYRASAPTGGSYNLTKHPILVKNEKALGDEATRAKTRAVLKRLGMIK